MSDFAGFAWKSRQSQITPPSVCAAREGLREIRVRDPVRVDVVKKLRNQRAGNNRIHARLMVGDKLLMASDAPPDRFDQPKGFSVTVGVDTAAEAERICNTFAEGGTVRMPMEETFFAERFGMVTDRFGTPWMILCEKKAA
jgi:uncharacterized glyoxalase superfamily protein PhnB